MESIIIYSDGACSGNPGPGGWAAILWSPKGKVIELAGKEEKTTNNRMEMIAVIEALKKLSSFKSLSTNKIHIYTDSKYIIQGINSWIYGWKKNGWKTAEGNDVSHKALWEELDQIIQNQKYQIDWNYVPGHSGVPGNERCDEIAVMMSKGQKVSLYQGDFSKYSISLQPPQPAALDKKTDPIYLSFVNGKLYRDKDWKSCEARVKGIKEAKFKKVQSQWEEEKTLQSWGLNLRDEKI